MTFKSDRQRKAVMAKLNQGSVRSDVKPVLQPTGKFRRDNIVNKNIPDFVNNKTITEKEMKLLQRRMNDKKVEHKEIFPDDKSYRLTPEHEKKGLDWLRNEWKTPKGVERKNNPFGEREQDILKDVDRVELGQFFDTGNMNFSFNVPQYTVYGKNGNSMDYYVSGGKIHILG